MVLKHVFNEFLEYLETFYGNMFYITNSILSTCWSFWKHELFPILYFILSTPNWKSFVLWNVLFVRESFKSLFIEIYICWVVHSLYFNCIYLIVIFSPLYSICFCWWQLFLFNAYDVNNDLFLLAKTQNVRCFCILLLWNL